MGAKKAVQSPAPKAGPGGNRPGSLRRWGRRIAVLALLAALAGGAAPAWHTWSAVRQIRAGIPDTPDLAGKPEALIAAVTDARNQARSWSEGRDGLERLGRLYHANGYYPQARKCWTTLRSAEPREARWPYFIADALRMSGHETEARPLLEETVRLAPDYAPAWLKLGTIAQNEGRLDDAERAYRRRLALLPKDPYATFGLARVEILRGRKAEARSWLEQCVRATPAFPSSHNVLAGLLESDGDTAGAARERWLGVVAGRFREADDPWIEELADDCLDPDRLMVLAAIDRQTRRGDFGRRFMERAIRLDPRDPRGYGELGQMYCERGDGARARDILERGIRLPGASAMLFARLSEAYRLLDQPEKALQAARRGLEATPGDADLSNALGIALTELARFEEALAAFRTSIANGAHTAEPNVNMAICLVRMGRKADAYACLHRALEIQPMFPKAIAELGYLELDAWKLDSAEQYIRAFYDAYPGMNRARGLMVQLSVRKAIVAARAGDAAAAENACRAGLQVDADSADLHGMLGVILADGKRYADAVHELETARHLNPADGRVLLKLGQVYAETGRIAEARAVLAEGEAKAADAAAAAPFRAAIQRLP